MRHKHADMIIAKAENRDLVVFCKQSDGWVMCSQDGIISWSYDLEYLLCPPQHKEAYLHWLNGGEIQVLHNGEWKICGEYGAGCQSWSHDGFLMHNGCDYRIRPRKEKRWIIAMKDGGSVCLCGKQLHVSMESAIEFAEMHGSTSHLQFIEIEIEV